MPSLTHFGARVLLPALVALALASCDRAVGPPVNGNNDPAADSTPAAKNAAGSADSKPAPAAPAPAKTLTTASLVTLPAPPPSDAQITASAARALQSEPALAGARLSVSTDHGVVSLTGSVRSPEQVAVAEARAQSPAGVMRVDAHVAIQPER